MLKIPLQEIAVMYAVVWPDRVLLNQTLMSGLDSLPYCQFLYALDTDVQQIIDNVNHQGLLTEHCGRDRSGAYKRFKARRPSVTAIQVVRKEGDVTGFVGAGLDLRDLPLTRVLYEEPQLLKQIMDGPASRGNVF
jgi:hypothetical protein